MRPIEMWDALFNGPSPSPGLCDVGKGLNWWFVKF